MSGVEDIDQYFSSLVIPQNFYKRYTIAIRKNVYDLDHPDPQGDYRTDNR